jgi:hypothetical protein
VAGRPAAPAGPIAAEEIGLPKVSGE